MGLGVLPKVIGRIYDQGNITHFPSCPILLLELYGHILCVFSTVFHVLQIFVMEIKSSNNTARCWASMVGKQSSKCCVVEVLVFIFE